MGTLFILSAPSGVGLTALVDRVLAGDPALAEGLRRAVSHTSRARREGEVDGRHYHFVDRRRFERLIEEDRLLEWTEVLGQLYGTSRAEVAPRLERGLDVVVEIDLAGAERLRARCPEARTVVVAPAEPAVSSSKNRLYDRHDCVIMTDEAKRAGGALAAILLGSRDQDRRADALPTPNTLQGPAGPRSRR